LREPLTGRQRRPTRIADSLRDDLVVHPCMLRDVERREMKAEGAHPPHEAAHQEVSGVPTAILNQAVDAKFDVGEQFLRTGIPVRPRLVGRLESLADLAEEDPVRHAIVARRRNASAAGSIAV
jgi:hypothetical protein